MRVFDFFLAVDAPRRFRRSMQTCLGDVGVAVDANAVLPVLDALQGGIELFATVTFL